MGTFEISKDVEAIYFYDGLVETTNDPIEISMKMQELHYSIKHILSSMSKKEFNETRWPQNKGRANF